MENQDEMPEKRFTEDIESLAIYDSYEILNFKAKAKDISIKGGNHVIKINNTIENLEIEGGYKEIHIKAPVNNLTIKGGQSKIYVHDFEDAKVDKLYIKGGNHVVEIVSSVNDLELHGGVNIIRCNYINSKINKITTIGGVRDIYLNPETDKCEKKFESGVCNFHKTEVKEDPIEFQAFLYEGDIGPTTLTNPKEDARCSICLQNYNEDKVVYFLPCAHYFHKNCLKPFYAGKIENFCPECKFKFRNNLVD